jgi:hypothetical protein
MKTRWIFIVAAILIVFGAALFLLDFRLISSQSNENSVATSIKGGNLIIEPSDTPAVTGLFVDGKGLVKNAVQAQAKHLLQSQAGFGEISDLNAIADKMDISVLYIDMNPEQFFWTPFYARSTYRATVAYANNGDISFRKQESPHFESSGDQPVLQIQASLTLSDTSYGVMSLPGYENYIAGKLADWAVDSLKAQMNAASSTGQGD